MPDFEAFTSDASSFLHWLALSSAAATVIAGVVLALQALFGRWLTPAGRQRLWLLVIVRLLLPVLPASALSIANIPIPKLWTSAYHAPAALVTSEHHETSGYVTTIRMGPIPTASAPAIDVGEIATAQPDFTWIQLAGLWLVVAVALLMRLIWVNHAMVRRLRSARKIKDASILRLMRECAAAVGLRRVPRIVETTAVGTPAVHGVWKPRILMPVGLIQSLSPAQRRHIILHELSHIRHFDVLANWLLAILSIGHWFNPLLWLAIARMKSDREVARDAWVIRVSGTSAEADSYGDTLIDVAQRLSLGHSRSRLQFAASLPGLFGRKTSLRRRLHMISRISDSRGSRLVGVVLLFLIAGGLLTRARAQQAPPAPQPLKTVEPPTAAPDSQPAGAKDLRWDVGDLTHQLSNAIGRGDDAEVLVWADRLLQRDPGNAYATEEKRLLAPRVPDPEAIRELARVVPLVQFDAVALSDVIDFLGDISGLNIFVNWKVLEAAGIDRNTPVSANVHNVKFSKALDLILDSVGGGRAKLGYTINQRVLTISTQHDLNRYVVIRVYDVRDLLDMPAGLDARSVAIDRPKRIDALIKLIEESIATDSWKDLGGEVASLRIFDPGGQLIVTQTPENHRQIVALLDRVREERNKQILLETEIYDCDSAELAKQMETWAPTTQPASKGIVVAADLVEPHLAELKRNREVSSLPSPRVTLFNGQKASVTTSIQKKYATDYTRVRLPNGIVRYDPIEQTVEPGVQIDVQATLSADQKWVTLNIHPKVTTLIAMAEERWNGTKDYQLYVAKPQLSVAETKALVSVPDGKILLMTVAQPDRKHTLLLVVKPTIVQLAAMEQKPFPSEQLVRPANNSVDLSSHYPWMDEHHPTTARYVVPNNVSRMNGSRQ